MQGHNTTLELELCTALDKGILVSPDDANIPKNLTLFLTPPLKNDEDSEEISNLLKLAVQEKCEQEELILLTKMNITIPLKTQDLKHRMRNFVGIFGRYFVSDSMMYINLQEVAEYIDNKENNYKYEFNQEKLFGDYFLDKIHWRIHRFLDSCPSGDVARVNTSKLEFKDMTE